jgi:hypothetical protein
MYKDEIPEGETTMDATTLPYRDYKDQQAVLLQQLDTLRAQVLAHESKATRSGYHWSATGYLRSIETLLAEALAPFNETQRKE